MNVFTCTHACVGVRVMVYVQCVWTYASVGRGGGWREREEGRVDWKRERERERACVRACVRACAGWVQAMVTIDSKAVVVLTKGIVHLSPQLLSPVCPGRHRLWSPASWCGTGGLLYNSTLRQSRLRIITLITVWWCTRKSFDYCSFLSL